MLRESKWLGRWTLALAVATVIMSWATWDMSSVSRSQLNLETSDEKQEIERTKKEAERIKGELVLKDQIIRQLDAQVVMLKRVKSLPQLPLKNKP